MPQERATEFSFGIFFKNHVAEVISDTHCLTSYSSSNSVFQAK